MLTFRFENDGKDAAAFVFEWMDDRHFLIYVAGKFDNPDIEAILDDLLF